MACWLGDGAVGTSGIGRLKHDMSEMVTELILLQKCPNCVHVRQQREVMQQEMSEVVSLVKAALMEQVAARPALQLSQDEPAHDQDEPHDQPAEAAVQQVVTVAQQQQQVAEVLEAVGRLEWILRRLNSNVEKLGVYCLVFPVLKILWSLFSKSVQRRHEDGGGGGSARRGDSKTQSKDTGK